MGAEHEIFYLLGDSQREAFVSALPAWIEEVIAPEGMRIDDTCFQVELLDAEIWEEVV